MLSADLPTDARSGVAHQVSRLADSLVDRGHEITLFSFSPHPAGSRYATHTFHVPPAVSRSKVGVLVGAPLAFVGRSYRTFDLIHAHGDDYLVLRRDQPIVRTFYGSALEEARNAERLRRRASQRLLYVGERLSRRKATVTVGISENTARSIGALDAIIPCGVDRAVFAPGAKSEAPSILFVGTISGRKRGKLAVEVFRDVVRPALPHAELWLVADEAVDGEGIRSFGRVDERTLARLFREAWLFTLPSSYEGFGVPYIEAMASGTAVVATPNPGACELVGPESGGLIVSPDALGEAALELLDDGPRRRAMGEAGRRFSERFGWSRVAESYESAYACAISRAQ